MRGLSLGFLCITGFLVSMLAVVFVMLAGEIKNLECDTAFNTCLAYKLDAPLMCLGECLENELRGNGTIECVIRHSDVIEKDVCQGEE